MYEKDNRIHTVVTPDGASKVAYHEKSKKSVNNIFFYQIYVHLGENTFIDCSWITIVHIRVNIFVRNSPSMPERRKRNQTRK